VVEQVQQCADSILARTYPADCILAGRALVDVMTRPLYSATTRCIEVCREVLIV
jgi:hypothetical protein